MKKEYWRPVVGFEGLYEVSNFGRVKSLPRNTTSGKILKLCNKRHNYKGVDLMKNGQHHNKQVHRLVAEAFIPNPSNLPCVNHKDENPQNNFVWINDDGSVNESKSNLEWCDQVYNNTYGTKIERMIQTCTNNGFYKKLTESNKAKGVYERMAKIRAITGVYERQKKPVIQYDKNTHSKINEFPSIQDAEQALGLPKSHISDCCKGKRKTAYGCIWRYKNEE